MSSLTRPPLRPSCSFLLKEVGSLSGSCPCSASSAGDQCKVTVPAPHQGAYRLPEEAKMHPGLCSLPRAVCHRDAAGESGSAGGGLPASVKLHAASVTTGFQYCSLRVRSQGHYASVCVTRTTASITQAAHPSRHTAAGLGRAAERVQLRSPPGSQPTETGHAPSSGKPAPPRHTHFLGPHFCARSVSMLSDFGPPQNESHQPCSGAAPPPLPSLGDVRCTGWPWLGGSVGRSIVP